MTTVVGLDAGNSEATLTIAPGRAGSALTIPSYVGSGQLAELLRIRGGAGESALESGEYALELGERATFVGQLALDQSRDATAARGDVARYWNGHTLRLLCTLVGAALPKTNANTVRVVTGLPVSVWSKDAARRVQQALIGTHRYTLNGRARELTVEGVMVVMEGAGALAAHGTGESVPQAVIDVGGRTTDLFWAEGMKPSLPRCTGAAIGIEKAGDRLCADFQRQYGRELRRSELRAIFHTYTAGSPPPPLFVDGKRVDLAPQVAPAVRAVGDEIASFVGQAWGEESGKVASEAARVLLIGGGAHYLAQQLRKLIPHLEVPKHPELANAQGYLGIGLQVPEAAWQKLRG